MERYILLISLKQHSTQTLHLINHWEAILKHPLVFDNFAQLNVSVIKFAHLFKGGTPNWLSIEELSKKFIEQLDLKNEDVWDDESIIIKKMKVVAENINSLADILPVTGSFLLDVFWIWDFAATPFPLSKNLEYFGCMKRLVSWHNAHVKLIISEHDMHDSSANEWSQHLNASMMTMSNIEENAIIHDAWRGTISISKDVVLKCFSLSHLKVPEVNPSKKSRYLQRTCFSTQLEVVSTCPYDSLTPFLLTNDRYSLNIVGNYFNCNSSKKWIQHLKENNLAVFLRLDYCNEESLPVSVSNFTTSTVQWKEQIQKGTFTTFPPLTKSTEHLTLLLITSEKDEDNFGIVLCFDLNQINPSVGCHLTNRHEKIFMSLSDVTNENIKNLLQDLPVFNKELFQKLLSFFIDAQDQIIKAWKEQILSDEKLSLMTRDELQMAIHALTNKILESFFSFASKFSDIEIIEQDKNCTIDDYLNDLENWEERKALLLWEDETNGGSQRKNKASFNFTSDKTTHIDCKTILKYFNKHGDARRNRAIKIYGNVPIRIHHCSFHPDFDEEKLKTLSWPEVISCSCPDVYTAQNVTSQSNEINLSLGQIKEKCMLQETLSSFVVPYEKIKKEINCSSENKSQTQFQPKQKYENLTRCKKNILEHQTLRRSPRKRMKIEHFSYKENAAKATLATGINLVNRRNIKASSEQIVLRRSPRKHEEKRNLEKNSLTRPLLKADHEEHTLEGNSKCKTIENDEMSERHKKKLRAVIADALEEHGIGLKHELFVDCGRRLFNLSKMFLKDVIGQGRTSDHMRNIVESHVKQTIDFFATRITQKGCRKKKQ